MSYDEDDDGIIAKLQQLFFNEYIGRVLIGMLILGSAYSIKKNSSAVLLGAGGPVSQQFL